VSDWRNWSDEQLRWHVWQMIVAVRITLATVPVVAFCVYMGLR
jgi:hypothetical protein